MHQLGDFRKPRQACQSRTNRNNGSSLSWSIWPILNTG